MTTEQITKLKARLTKEHLVTRTSIFNVNAGEGGLDINTAHQLSLRFEAYWRTWCEEDLRQLFDYLSTLEGKVVKLNEQLYYYADKNQNQ